MECGNHFDTLTHKLKLVAPHVGYQLPCLHLPDATHPPGTIGLELALHIVQDPANPTLRPRAPVCTGASHKPAHAPPRVCREMATLGRRVSDLV
jgi:hypothetical protein